MYKALLVGNGVNQVSGINVSLKVVMEELRSYASITIVENWMKPFPFAFEEIVFSKKNTYHENTKVLKQRISEIA